MLKELLPIMTEEERQQHAVLAQKGHLDSQEMKAYQFLNQKKQESVLSLEERHAYDELRRFENPSDLQKQDLIAICNKAGIDIPRNLSYFSKKSGTKLTKEEENRLVELTGKEALKTNEEMEFQNLSTKLSPKLSMWFHKWLYFTLIIGALFLLSSGVFYINGTVYTREGLNSDQVYAIFPALKSIDISFGILYLALAVGSLYTCRRLAQQKQNGPILLKAVIIVSMLMNIAYPLISLSAMRLPVSMSFNAGQLGNLLASAIYLIIIWIYYDKRKSMFIN